jgi:hypothetical protein
MPSVPTTPPTTATPATLPEMDVQRSGAAYLEREEHYNPDMMRLLLEEGEGLETDKENAAPAFLQRHARRRDRTAPSSRSADLD